MKLEENAPASPAADGKGPPPPPEKPQPDKPEPDGPELLTFEQWVLEERVPLPVARAAVARAGWTEKEKHTLEDFQRALEEHRKGRV